MKLQSSSTRFENRYALGRPRYVSVRPYVPDTNCQNTSKVSITDLDNQTILRVQI